MQPSHSNLALKDDNEELSSIPQGGASPALVLVEPITGSISNAQLIYYHMILRGRLRLGGVRNPLTLAFITLPSCLGIYWFFWYRRALQEVAFHANCPHWLNQSNLTSLIPIWHCVKIYRLARAILQIETQHDTPRTSPLLAAILALFPPLSLYYCQKKLNEYWLSQVKLHLTKPHSLAKRARKKICESF